MKKTIFIIIGLFIVLQWGCRFEELYVCDPDFLTFERSYSYEADTFSVNDMVRTPDDNFVICGNIGDDVFLLKIDKEGNTVFFERNVIPVTNETCRSIAMTPDNGFITCGQQDRKAYLGKYNALGKIQNQNTQTQASFSDCRCIAPTMDGQYVISGRISHNNGVMNTYVAPVVFNNTFPNIMSGYLPSPARSGAELAEAVIPTTDGYTVVGHSYNSPTPGNGTAVHFYRLDNNFDTIANSEKFYHLGTQQDIAHDVVETPQGNYMVVGKLHTASNTGNDIFVAEMNDDGEILNQYNYGGSREDIAVSIIHAHQSGQYIIVGHSASFGDGSDDIYVSKINQNGTVVWERTHGQAGTDERAEAILRTDDCGYIIAGYSARNGLRRPYVVKIDESGNTQ